MQTHVNAHLKRPIQEQLITAELVNDSQDRMNCLHRIADHRCVILEHTINEMLRGMTDDYDGGYWSYYNLSNGGFYMSPALNCTYSLSCENMFEREVSADTAGIIACAMAYSHLSFMTNGDCFAAAYYQLSDYIFQHDDASLIRAALD
jgi:hypothetical protein